MADPKSLSPLRKYHRKEKVEDLEGRFLRSLSAVAPTNAAVVSAVVKAATKHNVMLVRAHAMVAAGFLELRQPSLTCLRSGLQDPSVVVRAVTAYVIAERQFQELSGALSKSLEAEDDDEIRGWMEKAVAALSSRDPKEFDGFLGLTIDKPTSGRGGPGRNRREAGEGTEGGDAGKGASRRRRKGGDSGGKGKLE